MIPSFEMRRCAGHRLVAQTWGAVAGAAVGVVGSALTNKGGSSTNGGAGTQTQTKEPWAAAQPWIMNNMQTGQALQSQLAAQPFNAQQLQAYQNQGNQSAYMRAAVPSLLGQMSGQQLGFDRSNPNARPTAFNFNGTGGDGQGLLSLLNGAPQSYGNLNPSQQGQGGDFRQQTQSTNPADQYMSILRAGMTPEQLSKAGMDPMAGMNGSYGSFKYGSAMPQPGTKEYRDMNEYFAYGGTDPYNMYGKGVTIEDMMNPKSKWYDPNLARNGAQSLGYGAATDDGGAAAAVGSSANF